MASSRVNFMAANFSYAPYVTKANFMETLTKFLVSGFGPFNIDSIKVTNKVARVVTSEKKFYSLPGCKLAISGTGVTALDDSHEIVEVFRDGFSFEIDTPDREFTNGLTYSVPSLGWTLVKQTAILTIYKSESAAVPFYVVIKRQFIGNTADNRYNYHLVSVCYEVDADGEPKANWPNLSSEFVQVMPIHAYSLEANPTQFNAGIAWYFYGDPAMFLTVANAATTNTESTIRDGMTLVGGSSTFVGEAKSNRNSIPLTAICGTRVGIADLGSMRSIAWQFGNNTSPVMCGYISSASTFADAYIGARTHAGTPNYTLGGATYPKIKYQDWSGGRTIREVPFIPNISEFNFLQMEIIDRNGYRSGYYPGIWAIDNRPYGIETVNHRPFNLTINNRNKRGVLVRSSSNGGNGSGGSSTNPDNDAITWLDLSGPIR
jgi:hypothetical protein